MKLKIVLTLLTALVTTVFGENVVEVTGGLIRGHRLQSRKGREIHAFQGIPYAKAPLGELRFKPPQPVEPWDGILETNKDAPVCVQKGLFLTDDLTGQEDCLYLNVYTPKMDSEKPLDVMFWIHGGGWHSGSGSIKLYGPQYLLDKDIVLVTINYRLGPLGFLSTGDAVCPGNNGLKDQVKALKWVQENIAKFGGNPNSVTIFGESAGGASVEYHMLSPLSKGLFHRGISQSGTTLCLWAFSQNSTTRYQAETLATLVGCPTQPSEDLVACLRNKDVYELTGELSQFLEWNIDPMIPFRPLVENQNREDDLPFITGEPFQTLLSSNSHDLVPWMAGFIAQDGGIISATVYGKEGLIEELNTDFEKIIPMAFHFRETAPKAEQKSIAQKLRKYYFGDKTINKETKSELSDLYTDAFFLAGVETSVKLHSKKKAPVYYYYFDYRGTNSFSTLFGDEETDYGAVHLDELMYLFPQNHFFPGRKTTSEDEKMIDTITTLWTNFAIYGNPTPENSQFNTWKPVSSAHEYAQIKNDGLKMGQHLLKERAELWSKLPVKARISNIKEEL